MTTSGIEIVDYVILALACFFVILGLFRGVSGVFSLISASIISFAVSVFLWPQTKEFIDPLWLRVVAIIVLALITFGLVRVIVGKFVSKLLAQPADSIFGAVIGLMLGALLVYISANIPVVRDNSVIAREVSHLIEANEDVQR